MNTIHSSSLATYSTGPIKPEQSSLASKQVRAGATDTQGESQKQRPEAAASTPEQIKTALAKTGLNNTADFASDGNTRANKALQTYNRTRDQVLQTQLENSISRVDYYA